MAPVTNVLVAYATRHGSTEEIAGAVADELREHGVRVELRDAREVHDLLRYDAVVLGSAVYYGRWQRAAVRLLRRHRDELARLRLWLFQSGPLGHSDDTQVPGSVRRLLPTLGAPAPVTFAGRLDAGTSRGFVARKMVEHGRAGDFRDWDAIRDWAGEIARSLNGAPGR